MYVNNNSETLIRLSARDHINWTIITHKH
jgi:hypothetical protein